RAPLWPKRRSRLESRLLDVWRVLLEDRPRDPAESFDRAGAEDTVFRAASITHHAVRCQHLTNRERRRRGGVDDADVSAGDLFDDPPEQGAVRAAERPRAAGRPAHPPLP